jgi:hypothetical protein
MTCEMRVGNRERLRIIAALANVDGVIRLRHEHGSQLTVPLPVRHDMTRPLRSVSGPLVPTLVPHKRHSLTTFIHSFIHSFAMLAKYSSVTSCLCM